MIDTSRLGPSTPLRVEEIRGLINRLRRAHIHASVDEQSQDYRDIAGMLHILQNMHVRKAGVLY